MSASGWNYTIDDSSSVLVYTPHGDGGAGDFTQSGWQPWYSTPGGFSNQGGETAVGQSLHITSFPGASVQLQFYGSGIYLYGTTNGSYVVTLDSSITSGLSTSGEVLFAQAGLATGTHFINLTACSQPSLNQQLAFDYAVISNDLGEDAGPPIPIVYDNMNTTALEYSGNWTVKNTTGIPNSTVSLPYHRTTELGSSVAMNFTGGVGVAVNGTRNWGGWVYNVTLDGVSYQYNASTMWLIDDALLFYYYGLDVDQTHTLELVNTAGNGMQFDLNSITVFSPNRTEVAVASSLHKSTSHVGVIVGPVVGVLGSLAILGALLWWFIRRRRCAGLSPLPFTQSASSVAPYPSMSYAGDNPSIAALGSYKDPSLYSSPPPAPTSEHTPSSPLPVTPAHSSVYTADGPRPLPPLPISQSPTQAQVQTDQPQVVNVDHLIELIAERIDARAPGQVYDSHVPPPQYPARD